MTDFVRPKKHLGQHFLTDKNIAKSIVDSLDLTVCKNILEVGPGKGILTELLLCIPEVQFKCVDIDIESVHWLQNNLHLDEASLIHADFLKLQLDKVFGQELSIIGNFPYNISSQILFSIIEHRDVVPQMVGMFQLEVAQRIVSSSGSKDYGILSVVIQSCYDAEILFRVSEHVFQPPPKVKSAVVKMIRKTELPLTEKEFTFFRGVVKTSFGQRRKMLRNSLSSYGITSVSGTDKWLTKRPEQLSIDEFFELSLKLMNQIKNTE